MALTNDQYNFIMNKYDERQRANRDLSDSRLKEIYVKFPEYKALDDATVTASMEFAKTTFFSNNIHSDELMVNLKHDIARLSERKKLLLAQNGYPADYLLPVYTCPDCRDTGYIGNKKCHCFNQAIVNLLYDQSNINKALRKKTLNDFSLAKYSKTNIDKVTNSSYYVLAEAALNSAKDFVKNFNLQSSNLVLYGNAGLGKTYLSHCIANELITQGFTVLYLTASELFENLGRFLKNREDPDSDIRSYIMDCDLLIIDDLGSELINEFTISSLYICLNERLNAEHSTILSTNLDPIQIKNTYGERNFSRIRGYFEFLRFFGDDLRA